MPCYETCTCLSRTSCPGQGLADQHPTATILITAGVDPERAKAIQQHYPTLYLKPNITVHDIVWELCQGKGAPIQ
jgi:hypothetical protein